MLSSTHLPNFSTVSQLDLPPVEVNELTLADVLHTTALPYLSERDIQALLEANLGSAHERLFKRLLVAAHREQLLGQPLAPDSERYRLPDAQPSWRLYLTVERHHLYDYIEVNTLPIVEDEHGKPIAVIQTHLDLLTWVGLAHPHIEAEVLKAFCVELNNALLNELLCLSHRSAYEQRVLRPKSVNPTDFYQCWIQGLDASESLVFLEQWASVGHPYHPCAKTRQGFSVRDTLSYAPEFYPQVSIRFVAVAASLFITDSAQPLIYADWITTTFPEQMAAMAECLVEQNLSADDYRLVPVHPWQYDHLLSATFEDHIAHQRLIPLPDIKLLYHPGLSLRTMMPMTSNPLLPHIKLPICVQTTSAMRTVSPQSVHSGAAVGTLLTHILTTDADIAATLHVAQDLIGGYFHADNPEHRRFLSVIYRQNPLVYCKGHERLTPLASLFVLSPSSKLPLFLEMKSPEISIQAFFQHYCELVLTPHVGLFLKYGVVLEAHQQNTLVVWNRRLPVRLIVRDLGGIRIHHPSLVTAGLAQDFPSDSYITTDALTVARDKLRYACIYSNLGEMAFQIERHLGWPEQEAWRVIGKTLACVFEQYRAAISPNRMQEEYDAFFQQPWPMKGLMRARLQVPTTSMADPQGNRYLPTANPISGERSQHAA